MINGKNRVNNEIDNIDCNIAEDTETKFKQIYKNCK